MTDNLIGDRYVLGPLLGRGGMAEVRRARDTRLERDVAVKRLKVDLAGDPIFQERFRREAHAAAGLNHPNIVSVFDTGESYDEASGLMVPYIVMELVVGHTLREILHEGRKIEPTKALGIVQSVLEALDYSHRHGIIHRDIKPANVMLTTNGQVKVMDFGIARAVSDTAASMTQTASVIGTPQYLSPEQIRGEKVDRRSDIYSTGCLLYELLTGKPPFEGDSPVSLAYQHVRATPVPPSEVDPVISSQMDAIVLKALAKDPATRYQSAHEMSEDIGRLLAGQKVQAVIPPPVEEAPTEVMSSADQTQVMPNRTGATAKGPARAVEPPEEAAPSHIGRIIAIILAAMLVVAIAAAAIIYTVNKDKNNPTVTESSAGIVTVPLVKSMNQDNAEKALQSRGLVAQVQTYAGANDNTVGTVTSQVPSEGTSVEVGSTVVIMINTGPTTFQIPTDIIGKTTEDAQAELGQTFKNIKVVNGPPTGASEPANAAAGTVIQTDPIPGSMAAPDQTITLYIATGQITLPNLMGEDQESAMAELIALGIPKANITVVQSGSLQPANTVIAMDPPAGTQVAKTGLITLTVAIPLPTQTPTAPSEPVATGTATGPSSTPTSTKS